MPSTSLIVSGIAYSAVILALHEFETLAMASVTFYAGTVSLEMLSFLVLRAREPELLRPFRVPGGWIVACGLCLLPVTMATIGATCLAMEQGVWNVIGLALVIMATGPLLYPIAAWCKRDAIVMDDAA